MTGRVHRVLTLWLLLVCVGCADQAVDEPGSAEGTGADYMGHGEASDFDEVASVDGKADMVSARFDQNRIFSDAFFRSIDAVTVEQIQKFLEDSPYGRRNWLADEILNGRPFSEVLVEVAKAHDINPVVLLVRMQVEKSLISVEERPKQRTLDKAFGCGCHDGRRCFSRFAGFEEQLHCGAETMHELFEASVNEERGRWHAGKARETLDGIQVVPTNHVTAAMYGYTPWVLRGRGGNWLVWNITRRFVRHLLTQGEIAYPEGCSGGDPDRAPFVGTPCTCDLDCDFSHRSVRGYCHPAGLCSLPCQGACPDRQGYDTTFCVAEQGVERISQPEEDPDAEWDRGMCVVMASASNGHCADLPNTLDLEMDRFIGTSSSPPATREVCLPVVE